MNIVCYTLSCVRGKIDTIDTIQSVYNTDQHEYTLLTMCLQAARHRLARNIELSKFEHDDQRGDAVLM